MNKKIIHSVIEHTAVAFPEYIAVEECGGATITYHELNARANAVASILRDHGIGRDIIAGIMLKTGIEYAVSMLGILKTGGIFLPIEISLPKARLEHILNWTRPRVIITDKETYKQLSDLLSEFGLADDTRIITLSDTGMSGNLPIESEPEDSCYVIYTSGSTGVPKFIEGWHKGLSHYVHWQINEFGLNETSRISQMAPVTFEASLKDFFVAFCCGATLCIPDNETKTNSAKLIEWIERSGLTLLQCVPSYLRLITREIEAQGNGKRYFPEMKLFFLSGDTLYGKDIMQWREAAGDHMEMVNLYGPAEVTLLKSFSRISNDGLKPNEIVPIGKPISNTAILILNGDTLCKPGKIGEICVKSPFITKGYYRSPELTAERYVQNPLNKEGVDIIYRTGDLGRYAPDMSVEFIGRMDSQVKVYGNRIELAEIEGVILSDPRINQAVVVPYKTPDMENTLACYYTEKEPIGHSELRTLILARLPDYMVPAFFVRLDRFQLNLNGKIDRKALPKPEGLVLGKYEAPAGKLEEELSAIWAEVLGLKKVGATNPFIEIGGDSLKAIRVISRIYKVFEVEVSVKDFFENPTVRDQARFIGRSERFAYREIKPVGRQEYYDLSHAQRRLWLLDRLEKDSSAYNITGSFLIEGSLDIPAFKRSIQYMTDRHESLRTTFIDLDGQPKQKVHEQLSAEVEFMDLSGSLDAEAGARRLFRLESSTAFDLATGPLFRIRLVKVSESSHVFIFNIHHIISDVWSINVMTRELSKLYAAYVSGEEPDLPPLHIQYRDYSAGQGELLGSGAIERYRTYWHDKLKGPLPVLNLPSDFPRPPVKTFSGDALAFSLEKDTTQGLNRLADTYGVSLFAVLISLVRVLLYRYTGQKDIIIGAPSAGRNHTDLEDQIGFYLNTLALRDEVDGTDRFADVLARVMNTNTGAFDHQLYPFDRLVDELNVDRDVSRSPVFDVMAVLQNTEQTDLAITGARVKAFDNRTGISKFDMDFVFIEEDGRLQVIVEYNTDLFVQERIRRLEGHFRELVNGVLEEPSALLKDLPLLTEDELRRIDEEFNNTAASYPEDKTLVALFEERIALNPGGDAVVFGGDRLTYGELNNDANRLAHLLRNKGVRPDGIVAVMEEPSLSMPVELLAILKSGGAYLPIDPAYPEKRKRFMLDDSQTSILLTREPLTKGLSFTALRGLENSPVMPATTCPRGQILDLDSMPMVDRSLVDYEEYHKYIGQSMAKHSIALQATRGCPYHCAYCHKIWPKRHIHRSAANIFHEVKQLYDIGVRRFVFIDDIFNLNRKNSSDFFELLIKNNLKVQLFFPNGLRGDILTPDYIDLMVEAGTVNFALALETASPRLQKLIGKNLNLDRLHENLEYITSKHPQVILELFTMHGFPTETEEEAMMTLDFIKAIKWLHFPYVHILKIFPDSDMERLALENGVSREAIRESVNLAFHELPDTLPFPKAFSKQYQADFFNEYFMSRERLLKVLPMQMRLLTEDELVQKYDSYLPIDIKRFEDLLGFMKITRGELGGEDFLNEELVSIPAFNEKALEVFPKKESAPDALRVLLLDLSQFFSSEAGMLYDVVEPPLGLMYLLTYLNDKFGAGVNGRIAKSRMDFDDYAGLKSLIVDFRPDVIGIRTLTFYKEFFHKTVSLLRQWGVNAPIIAGGPYPTSSYASILKDANVDLVVLGEGEETFAELIGKIMENNGKMPAEDVLKTINGCAFVGTSDKTLSKESCREVLLLDHLPTVNGSDIVSNPVVVNSPGDLAYIIYTSGSTGVPKGVMVEHRNVVRLLFNSRMPFAFSERDVWIQSHSFCFDFSVWEMYGALLYGGKLVIPRREDVRDIRKYLEIIREQRVTVLNQTPGAFYNLIDEVKRTGCTDLDDRLRCVIFGGDRLEPVYLKVWTGRYSTDRISLINMYGITETTVHVTFCRLEEDDIDALAGTSPIGLPIPETTVYVCDEDMNLMPVGVAGELYVGGTGVSRGYLNRPDLTEQRFIENPFDKGRLYKTGDLGRWSWDGRLEYLGRNDDQVQLRGYRVELGEIENGLLSHPSVKECVVLPVEDEGGAKALAAYLVFLEETSVTELRAFLGRNLADYMIPAYFIPVPKMPLTANGKIDKKSLPDPTRQGGPGLGLGSVYEPPRSDVEKAIASVWEGVLGREGIGIHDNYFALGGDSIKAIQVVSRLHREDLKCEMLDIFRFPTVSGLATRVERAKQDIEQDLVTGPVPLTAIQSWFFEEHRQCRHHYNQATLLHAKERLNADTLRAVLSAIQLHHDSLRMRYPHNNAFQEDCGADYPLSFEVLDLREVGDAVFKMEAHAGETQAGIDLESGPMMKAVLYRLNDGDRLLIVIHHLVIDGVSWRILAEDIRLGYEQYNSGQVIDLPLKTHSFKTWAEQLRSYAAGETLLKEKAFWLSVETSDVKPLPYDLGTEGGKVHRATDRLTLGFILSRDDTEALLTRVNNAYNTEINDILLVSLARALKTWHGEARTLIDMEGHGREGVIGGLNITRTVGWFTSLFPLLLQLPDSSDTGYQIKYVKESLRKVPNKGVGYGILKYLTPAELKTELKFTARPRISFNYLGRFDEDLDNGLFIVARESYGAAIGPETEMLHDLEINGMINEGRLEFSFSFNGRLFKPATVERLSDAYKNELENVVRYCVAVEDTEITPSDIDYDGFSLDELENVLKGLEEGR